MRRNLVCENDYPDAYLKESSVEGRRWEYLITEFIGVKDHYKRFEEECVLYEELENYTFHLFHILPSDDERDGNKWKWKSFSTSLLHQSSISPQQRAFFGTTKNIGASFYTAWHHYFAVFIISHFALLLSYHFLEPFLSITVKMAFSSQREWDAFFIPRFLENVH